MEIHMEHIRAQLKEIIGEQKGMRADFHRFEVTNEHRLTTVEVSAGRKGAIYGALTSVLTAIGLAILALVKGVI